MKLLILTIYFTLLTLPLYGQTTITISGKSMEPALMDGESYATSPLSDGIDRGDVLLFTYGAVLKVKRAVAVPGDRLSQIHVPGDSTYTLSDGSVYPARPQAQDNLLVDGVTVSSVTPRLGVGPVLVYLPDLVPADSYYVRADSYYSSADSRRWGFIPLANILAVIKGHPFKPHLQPASSEDSVE